MKAIVGKEAVLRSVQFPVTGIEPALSFYQQVLAIPVKFVDGNRYAALDAGGPSLALVSPEENLGSSTPLAAFRVDNVEDTLEATTAAGGSVVIGATEGPHETRALVCDPWGNHFVVYATNTHG